VTVCFVASCRFLKKSGRIPVIDTVLTVEWKVNYDNCNNSWKGFYSENSVTLTYRTKHKSMKYSLRRDWISNQNSSLAYLVNLSSIPVGYKINVLFWIAGFYDLLLKKERLFKACDSWWFYMLVMAIGKNCQLCLLVWKRFLSAILIAARTDQNQWPISTNAMCLWFCTNCLQ